LHLSRQHCKNLTVDSVGFTHGGLDVKSSNVLPSLLEEGNQEVDTHVDVLSELFITEVDGTNGGSEAENLLKLESDSGSKFLDLFSDVFGFSQRDWEFIDLIENVSGELRDLFHEGFRSKELVVWLGPLLDELLVLVEFLKTIDIDERNASLLSLVAVSSSTNKSNLSLRVRLSRESDGSGESFISVGIVVSKTNLELNSFVELSLLLFSKHLLNGSLELFT